MRSVRVQYPSFPEAAENANLTPEPGLRWQVLCGDRDHWRSGIFSPPESSRAQIAELERHDCPELFLLLDGRLTLVCRIEGEEREIELRPAQPVLVTAPHSGYCPDGPHTGRAFVVERDKFRTEYRALDEWATE